MKIALYNNTYLRAHAYIRLGMRIILSSLCSFVIAASLHAQVPTEISLKNPGFEQPDPHSENTPLGWGTGGKGRFTHVRNGIGGKQTHEGTGAVSITDVAPGIFSTRWQLLGNNTFDAVSGDQFAVTTWLKGSALDLKNDGYRIVFEWYDVTGKILSSWSSSTSLHTLKANDTWQQVSHDMRDVVVRAPLGTAKGKLLLVFARRSDSNSTQTEATLSFDDVTITRVAQTQK